MKTSPATGFAAAALPVQAQTAITTDGVALVAGDVAIRVGSGQMPAYRAAPAQVRPAPTILVVQEIFGVHEYIKDVCRRFAKLGYLAVAPELYARQGDPAKIGDIPTLVRQIVSKVPDAQVMGDLDACVAWAANNGGDIEKLGITGFCWGGRITWLYAAHSPEPKGAKLRAAVAWYGRLVGESSPPTPLHPLDLAGQVQVPVLGLYGGADSSIPLESVARMERALAANPGAGARSHFIVYPEAPHAFHADYRASYRKDAAQDGWKRCLEWMQANGVR